MANKNDPQTGAKDQAPVEKAAVKPPVADPESRHNKLRSDRRKLEAELAEVDDKLREAISNGDLASLESLTTRKSELPKLFIQASIAETTARQEITNAEDQANLKLLRAAEDDRDKMRSLIQRRQLEFEKEIAALNVQLEEASERVSTASVAIEASRNLSASADAGFKKSLAKLAGV
jgi:hypothetical protein